MLANLVAAIVEPHFLFRDGISLLLQEEGIKIAVASATFDELLEGTRELDEGLLIILSDENLGSLLQANIIEVRKRKPLAKIILLLRDFDDETRQRSQQLNVQGVLSKSISRQVMIRSIELVMLGECVSSVPQRARSEPFHAAVASPPTTTEVANALPASRAGVGAEIQALAQRAMPGSPQSGKERETGWDALTPAREEAVSAGGVSPAAPVVRQDRLSAREIDILMCLVEGLSNKVIARRCDIAEATVKVHLKGILRKIRVLNRTQAAVWMMNQMHEPATASTGPFDFDLRGNGAGVPIPPAVKDAAINASAYPRVSPR